MTYSIRATIRALVAPKHTMGCPVDVWTKGLQELKRRGCGTRESGAFLLGYSTGKRRTVVEFVFYDDLDPDCLTLGYVLLDGGAYGKLWQHCREKKTQVIGDIHTHPGMAFQSLVDSKNPMIGIAGHIAIIVPNFALQPIAKADLGVYEYLGNHQWKNHSGRAANRFLHIGI